MAHGRTYEVHGGGSSSNSSYGLDGGKTATVVTEEYDKQFDEESPLLSRAGTVEADDGGDGKPSAAWLGAADFEGVHWTKRPSINWLLPAYFLFAVAFGGIIAPKINLMVSLVCRDYLSDRQLSDPTFNYNPPTNLMDDNPQCRSPAVQSKVTLFTLYISLISGVISAITCPKIGALSDRYGRTPILALLTCGGLANEVITILAAKFPDTVPYQWFLLGAAFDGICGSFISGMALTHAYATDCVAPPKRAIAFGYFHACLFTGIAIGPLIAAYVYKFTGDLLTIFYIALGCHAFFTFYVGFVVPESLSKKRQIAARERHARAIADRGINPTMQEWLRGELNLLAPLKILYPTGPESSSVLRRNLILLSAVDTIIFGTAMGAGSIVIIYSKAQFGWGPFETNIFMSVANSTRVSTLIIVLPILKYFFRTRVRRNARRASGVYVPQKNSGSDNLDLWTVRCSIMFEVLGFAFYAIARRGEVFMLAGALAAFGGIGSPTLQSALTKHVPHEKVGELLGATGLLHALARIACPTITSLIYAFTVKVFPQAVFVVLSCGFVVAFTMACAIRPHVYLADEQDPKTPVSSSETRLGQQARRSELTDEEIIGI